MDCIDCHNRPTHIFDKLEPKVDFGLYSKKIDPDIPGIREDSLTVLQKKYASHAEAREKIVEDLLALQSKRHGADFVAKNEQALITSGTYLLQAYLENVWPKMRITWGTYKQHIGHQDAEEGYGPRAVISVTMSPNNTCELIYASGVMIKFFSLAAKGGL